jgi:hypothetical protein
VTRASPRFLTPLVVELVAPEYTLAIDGDSVERRAWSTFLKHDFPSYETYWLQSIVSLTKRPGPGGFRPKAELDVMGKTDHAVCLAQLHYTVLGHLQAAYDLRNARPPLAVEDFVHIIVRLSAAGDVAHEFLGRLTNPGAYDPWSEDAGARARHAWRKLHPELDDIHDYRNRLLHGRMPMGVIVSGFPGDLWLPMVGHAIDLDWRDITEHFDRQRFSREFDRTQNIAAVAWRAVVKYLETNWRSVLS